MDNENKKIKHFMSVLGTGEYFAANYSLCDKENRKPLKTHNSAFIQASVFKLLCQDFSSGDRISIFITDDSEKKHRKDLQAELEEQIKGRNIDLSFVKIKNGMTSSEQWENFNLIYDTIGNDEEVTADLTHGFRTLPIQLYTILGYAETLKKITVKGIYYGAFEQTFGYKGEEFVKPEIISELKWRKGVAAEKIEENNKMLAQIQQYTPIIDYNEYLKILDLSRAAFVFEQTGNAKSLVETANESFKDHTSENEYRELKKHYTGIESVSDTIRAVRGGSNAKGKLKSILHALKYWEDNRGVIEKPDSCLSEFKAIENITDYIDDVIEDVFSDVCELNTEENKHLADMKTGIDTVEWCIKYDLIQAGYTALEETVTTWILAVSDKDFYEKIRTESMKKEEGEYKEEISKEVLNRLIRERATDIINDYNNKNFKENISDIREMGLEPLTIEFIENHQEYNIREICKLVKSIKQIRNDLNHFGFSDSIRSVETIREKLKEQKKRFVELIVPKEETEKNPDEPTETEESKEV